MEALRIAQWRCWHATAQSSTCVHRRRPIQRVRLSVARKDSGANLPERRAASALRSSISSSFIAADSTVEPARRESAHTAPLSELESGRSGDIKIGKPARSVILIGDIHGQYDKLLELWGRLEEEMGSYEFSHSKVVFLGDYTDRGPDVREVVEFLSGLPAAMPNQVCVLSWSEFWYEETGEKI